MKDVWENYAEYKSNSSLAERYYTFIAACFKEGIRLVAGSGQFENALDVACGAGDNTLLLTEWTQ